MSQIIRLNTPLYYFWHLQIVRCNSGLLYLLSVELCSSSSLDFYFYIVVSNFYTSSNYFLAFMHSETLTNVHEICCIPHYAGKGRTETLYYVLKQLLGTSCFLFLLPLLWLCSRSPKYLTCLTHFSNSLPLLACWCEWCFMNDVVSRFIDLSFVVFGSNDFNFYHWSYLSIWCCEKKWESMNAWFQWYICKDHLGSSLKQFSCVIYSCLVVQTLGRWLPI